MIKKTNLLAALAAAVMVSSAGPASAGPITIVEQLIHFDDAGNGDKSYTTADANFLFKPTNFQSGNCAESTDGGNGSCIIEGNQNVLPELTRLTTDSNNEMIFSLESFYFELTGNGGTVGDLNSFSAAAGGTTTTFQLGTVYDNVYLYDPLGSLFLVDSALVHNTGYIADVSALTHFDNVSSVQFSAATTAQVRLDCVATSFDGTTTDPTSNFSNGCGVGATAVPEPTTLALLFAGMGVAGFTLRKSRKST